MKTTLFVALLFLTVVSPAIAMDATEFTKAIRSSHPSIRWKERLVLNADLTCRARQDLAILGVQGRNLHVAILPSGPKKQPIVLPIESGLLASQTTMSVESQDFEMGTGEPGDIGPLPGFRRSKTCKGLKLDDDRIDSVHIYWNRIEGRFQIWQR
jgi:hypothetical protein